MKITRQVLRKIILQELKARLQETPLGGIEDFEASRFIKYPGFVSSIGYGKSRYPSYVEDVKKLYSKTRDNWFIITLDDVSNIHFILNDENFKSWVASKNFPKDAKIIVSSSDPIEDDFASPNWAFAHDIIGHSAGLYFFNSTGYVNSSAFIDTDRKRRKPLARALHSLLPREVFQVDTQDGEALFDALYDIFAAIVLGYLSQEKAISVLYELPEEDLEKNIKDVNLMFVRLKEWVDSIPPGVPYPVKSW